MARSRAASRSEVCGSPIGDAKRWNPTENRTGSSRRRYSPPQSPAFPQKQSRAKQLGSYPATPFCLETSRGAIPPKPVGSKDCRAACGLRLHSHAGRVKNLQGRKFPILPQRDPPFRATPARRRLAARRRGRAVAPGWSPRSERRSSLVMRRLRDPRGDGSI